MKDIDKKIRYYFIETGQIPPITKAEFLIRANYLKEMNIDLTLKKEWFDMIASGEKKEEYREVKPYWCQRLTTSREDIEAAVWCEFCEDLKTPTKNHHCVDQLMDYFDREFKKFETVTFRNGYQKDAPTIVKQIEIITVDTGKPEWGAIEGQYYFVIKFK